MQCKSFRSRNRNLRSIACPLGPVTGKNERQIGETRKIGGKQVTFKTRVRVLTQFLYTQYTFIFAIQARVRTHVHAGAERRINIKYKRKLRRRYKKKI